MKKIISLITAAALTLGFTGCNSIKKHLENTPDLVIDQMQTVNTQKKLIEAIDKKDAKKFILKANT